MDARLNGDSASGLPEAIGLFRDDSAGWVADAR
jgi:hypothetical protein